HEINMVVDQRVVGHGGKLGLMRILRDRNAAGSLDRDQAVHSVVTAAAEQDADDATAAASCGGLEERIDRRSREVLPGTPVQSNAPVLDEHVLVTRCKVDPLGADDFIIFRLDDGVGCSSTEYRGQPTGLEKPATVNDRCDGAPVIL